MKKLAAYVMVNQGSPEAMKIATDKLMDDRWLPKGVKYYDRGKIYWAFEDVKIHLGQDNEDFISNMITILAQQRIKEIKKVPRILNRIHPQRKMK